MGESEEMAMGNLAQATIQAQQKTVAGQKIATGYPQGMPLHGSILQRAAVIPAITPVHGGILQRCSGGVECPECRQRRLESEGMIQRAAVSAAPVNSVPPVVHEVLNSPGQLLDAGTRAFMEPRFGHDFSQVRVHTDGRAAESARAVNALAYAVGRDIVFGSGQYSPGTSEGRRLMAHELTHVVQQGAGIQGLQGKLEVTDPGDRAEQEAESVSSAIWHGKSFTTISGAAKQIAREVSDAPVTPETVEAAETTEAEESSDLELPPLTFSRPPKHAPSLFKPDKEPRLRLRSFCRRHILAEGTCRDLALGSRYICCDPERGVKRPGRRTSQEEPGKVCTSETWTPIFTCDNTCKTALEKGCDDDDHWMALPPKEFKRSKCNEQYTICADGKKTQGYVRDRSSSKRSYEVSPGIQKALGVKVGDSFQGAIYPPDADQRLIDLDPCCNWPPLMVPELKLKSGTETGLPIPTLEFAPGLEGAEQPSPGGPQPRQPKLFPPGEEPQLRPPTLSLGEAPKRQTRSAAEQIATVLRNAVEGLGTDEDAIFNALTGRTPDQIAEIKAAYEKLSGGETLEARLRDELSGKDLTRALSLLSGGSTPTEATPRQIAMRLREAVEGLGTNESAIIAILTGRSPTELAQIRAEYARMYKENLQDRLKDELSGKELIEASILDREGLLQPEDEIKVAIAGLGTDEERLFAVLKEISGDRERIIRTMNQYAAKGYGNMLEDIRDDLSGGDLEQAMELLHGATPSRACSDDERKEGLLAISIAISRIQNTLEKLDADITRGTLSYSVRSALERRFNPGDAASVVNIALTRTVRSVFSRALADLVTRSEVTCGVQGSCVAKPTCEKFVAAWTNPVSGAAVRLCPAFFACSPDRAGDILHEFIHHTGVRDVAYIWEQEKFSKLTPPVSLSNPDSYAFFAKDVE
jgi:Domain of unknown function (DUF4157)/Annexin/Lysine-specific metallo-endopeptidase